MPSKQMTPTAFTQATVDALFPCGVNVGMSAMDWIESQNMVSFPKSACELDVFLEINYRAGEMSTAEVVDLC